MFRLATLFERTGGAGDTRVTRGEGEFESTVCEASHSVLQLMIQNWIVPNKTCATFVQLIFKQTFSLTVSLTHNTRKLQAPQKGTVSSYQWPCQEPIHWRYLPYIRPIFQALILGNIPAIHIAKHMVRLRTSICWIPSHSH